MPRKLVILLIRHDRGERAGWRVVNVPSEEDEDDRRLHRDLRRLNKERTALRNSVHNLLAAQGLSVDSFSKFGERIERLRRWDDSPLPPDLQRELRQVDERLQLVNRHIRELRAEQKVRLEQEKSPKIEQVRRLTMLKVSVCAERGCW